MGDLLVPQLFVEGSKLRLFLGGKRPAVSAAGEGDHCFYVFPLCRNKTLAKLRRACFDGFAQRRQWPGVAVLSGIFHQLVERIHLGERPVTDVFELIPKSIERAPLNIIEHEAHEMVILAIEKTQGHHFIDRHDFGVTKGGREQVAKLLNRGGKARACLARLAHENGGARCQLPRGLRVAEHGLNLEGDVLARLLGKRGGRDELIPFDKIGGDAYVDDRGRPHQQARGVHLALLSRAMVEQRGLKSPRE